MVGDQELDGMRGGFEMKNNGLPLSFSFGIDRATFLNGQLVSTSTLVIPALPGVINGQGMPLADFNIPINLTQNGSGNTFTLPGSQDLQLPGIALIQNTLDNQVISNVTVINASITSRNFLQSLAIQYSLNQMVFNSLH